MVSFCKLPGDMKLPGSHIWKISPKNRNHLNRHSHEIRWLSNSGLAAAKLGLGSCQTRIWRLPSAGLAATERLITQNRFNVEIINGFIYF